MNPRTTIVLALVAAALGAFIWLGLRQGLRQGLRDLNRRVLFVRRIGRSDGDRRPGRRSVWRLRCCASGECRKYQHGECGGERTGGRRLEVVREAVLRCAGV